MSFLILHLYPAGGHAGPGHVAIIASVICPDGWRLSDNKQTCLRKLLAV